jgi:hypothetical protein
LSTLPRFLTEALPCSLKLFVKRYTLSLETSSGMVDDFYYTEEAALKVSTMCFYEKRFEAEKKSVPYVGLGIISLLVIMSFIALST